MDGVHDMSGIDGFGKIDAENNEPGSMTAFDDEKVCARVLKAGACGYLKKPFEDSALVQCLEKALTRGSA